MSVCVCVPDRRFASVQSGRQELVCVSVPDRRFASVQSGRQGLVCECVCVCP